MKSREIPNISNYNGNGNQYNEYPQYFQLYSHDIPSISHDIPRCNGNIQGISWDRRKCHLDQLYNLGF